MLAIRFIGRLRKYLSKDQLNMVVNALLRHACIIIIIIIIIAACKKNCGRCIKRFFTGKIARKYTGPM